MKKTVALTILVQFLVLAAFAAEPQAECSLCVGSVADLSSPITTVVPLLVETSIDDLATTGDALTAMTPEQRKHTTVLVRYGLDAGKDPLLQVEERTKSIVEWARLRGPFDAFGIVIDSRDPAVASYAIKRLAVTAQGLGIATRIVIGRTSSGDLAKLFDNGAQSYFDALLVDGNDVQSTFAWMAERDPSKKLYAVVTPQSPNALFDLGKALSAGAVRAYSATPLPAGALASINRTLTGDWAFDATSRATMLDAKGAASSMPLLTFVSGEDLRTVLIPRGDAAAPAIVTVAADQYQTPRRVDVAGERAVTDTGNRGGRLLVGTPAATQPFLVVVDQVVKPEVTRESVEVATQRGITVEEIIRNHQAYDAYQESIEPRYIARNETKLRFAIDGGEAIEATIGGDYFSAPKTRADWVWQDFFVNGVRWRYGRIPELPLIQAEKVTQLPLDLHLTNDYRYTLVRETTLNGYRVYEVRFEPPRNAPESLPLYRGTVWIDARTWARVRINMIQLNLTGEVLSNEERLDFLPFSRATKAPITAAEVAKLDAREVLWLPYDITAQQVISTAGRGTVVQRATTFANFRLDPPEFDTLLAQISASDARMVRETDAGLRYLDKRPDGERVVKEGFDTARIFLLAGLYHDEGLDYPVVPLGGVNYFNFNLKGTGIQTNVFFAGAILIANVSHPNVGGTQTNLGFDFFGLALPFESTIFRNGEEVEAEAIKQRPAAFALRAGHPFAQFGKIDFSFGISHFAYSKADDTADDFVLPQDTFLLSSNVSAQYARWGYTVSGFYDYARRTSWEPWGNLSEYDPDQKSVIRYGGSLSKSIFLPKFQRIGMDVSYFGGIRQDRFTKWELGNFGGSTRVHGIRSGSVRAEEMILAHASYGFVFSDQFRLEAFYDHALVDDTTAGYEKEPFQGIGIAGQTIGPWGTLLRLDLGKTIGRNAQDGFVANVVFLKLF